MPRTLHFLVLLVLAALLAVPSTASAGPVTGTDSTGDGRPDIRAVSAGWSDDGWLVFAVANTRNFLIAGEDVGVFLDTTGDLRSDFQLRLHFYLDRTSSTTLYTASNGNWMFPSKSTTYAGGGFDANGTVMLWVHAYELGYPRGNVNFTGFAYGGPNDPVSDYAPNGGYWILPGSGVNASAELPTATTPGETVPAPGSGSAPATQPGPAPVQPAPVAPAPVEPAPVRPELSGATAKVTIRSLARRLFPKGARVSLSRCGALDVRRYRCEVRATRGGRSWKGTATATMSESGRYTATWRARR